MIKNRMYLIPSFIVLLLLIGCNGGSSVIPTPTPIINQISNTVDGVPLTISVSTQYANAIFSVNWKGKEFINNSDHGRQLQGTDFMDCGQDYTYYGWNPTEAGSVPNGAGPISSSIPISITASGNNLVTKTQMAFWEPEKVGQILSNHILTKDVTIGHPVSEHIISYNQTFYIPPEEVHTNGVFGIYCAMTTDFSESWMFHPVTQELTNVPYPFYAFKPYPVILTTPDHNFAMGVYIPSYTLKSGETNGTFAGGHYGIDNIEVINTPSGPAYIWFAQEWHDVVPTGNTSIQYYVVVGTFEDVKEAISLLHYYIYPKD